MIRSAQAKDVDSIHKLIVELAIYEKEPDAVTASVEDIERSLFTDNPVAFCHVAEIDGEIVGIAIWFLNYSTWLGKTGLYLEDLFVKNDIRRSGVGSALIEAVKQIAKESGSTRLYWNTDKNNEVARKLYEKFASEAGFVQYRVQFEL